MHYQDRNAHEELRNTPRRRQTPQWLPPRTYISLVDVLFVAAAVITAVWFITEHHTTLWEYFRYEGKLWNLLKSALDVVTSAGR